MQSVSDFLQQCVKGDSFTFDGKRMYVKGVADLSPMGRKNGQGPFVVIPNGTPIRLVWTETHLFWYGPLYEKGPTDWMVMERADPEELKVTLQDILKRGGDFGLAKQAQHTVSIPIDGETYWFEDIGTMGSDDTPTDNEGGVLAGPMVMRFYHVATNGTKKGSSHVMYLGPQPQESSAIKKGGKAAETLWKGITVDPDNVVSLDE